MPRSQPVLRQRLRRYDGSSKSQQADEHRPQLASAAHRRGSIWGRGRSRSAHLITTADLRARAWVAARAATSPRTARVRSTWPGELPRFSTSPRRRSRCLAMAVAASAGEVIALRGTRRRAVRECGARSRSYGIAGAHQLLPELGDRQRRADRNGRPRHAGARLEDGADGLNHEHALVQLIRVIRAGTGPRRRPSDSSGIHRTSRSWISADGTDLYVTYDGFLDPFQTNMMSPRRFQGVLEACRPDRPTGG